MHYHLVEDERGNVVDLIPFCCDNCHRDYCAAQGLAYGGWYGCQEGGDSAEFCAQCGVFAGGTPDCDCQRDNVVIARFPRAEGERCEHSSWIQLPCRDLGEHD